MSSLLPKRITFLIEIFQTMGLALQPDGTGSSPCTHTISRLIISYAYRIVSLFTAGTMIGFDASGHIAEETKNAR